MKILAFGGPSLWGEYAPVVSSTRKRGSYQHCSSVLMSVVLMMFLLGTPVMTPAHAVTSRPSTDVQQLVEEQRCDYIYNTGKEVKGKALYIYGEENVTLVTSHRLSHRLLTEVVSIFIKEHLGYTKVATVYSDAIFPDDIHDFAYAKSNHTNFVPDGLVNMEVWIPPLYGTSVIKDERLRSGMRSSLGVGGRFGWFFPKKLVSERGIIDHWRSFEDNDSAIKIFSRTSQELEDLRPLMKDSDSGRFFCDENVQLHCRRGMFIPDRCRRSQSCAVLFVSYFHGSEFLVDQIIEMKLRVQIAWLGPHLTEEFVRENMNWNGSRSILVFYWTPNVLLRPLNFTSVAFPPCSDYTDKNNRKYLCNYEFHRFHKYIWDKLYSKDKDLYEFIKQITLSGQDYSDLIDEYISLKEKSIHKAACQWIKNHKLTWPSWRKRSSKPKLYFFGFFPTNVTLGKYLAPGNVPAFEMAIGDINANSSILPNYTLVDKTINTQCDANIVMLEFINIVKESMDNGTHSKIIGIIGPACSETLEPLVGVSKYFKIPIISYGAEGSISSNRKQYPYFFRTIPENRIFMNVYLQLFKKLNWKRVASLSEDGHEHSQYHTPLQDFLQPENITFYSRKFPEERESNSMVTYLDDLRDKDYKIIIGDFDQDDARYVICDAYKLGMTGMQGYVWFLPRWFSSNWYIFDWNTRNITGNYTYCTTAQMEEALQGHMSLSYKNFADDNDFTPSGKTVKEWKKEYKQRLLRKNLLAADYAGYTYDAVWTFALALEKLFKENLTYTATLRDVNTTKKFVEYIRGTSFNGVSGHINFTGGTSRVTDIIIWQFINKSYKEIGRFFPNHHEENQGKLDFHSERLIWPSGNVPTDGSTECIVEGFRRLMGDRTPCTDAIIVVCTLGFIFLGLFLIFIVCVLKKRYDARLKLMEETCKNQNLFKNLEEWEISKSKIIISWKLGEGQFGKVYGGECYINSPDESLRVAVKTLKVGATVSEKLDFLTEADTMKNLKHENIVSLVGICTESEPFCTIMEFMLYGDLHTYLLARRNLVNEENRFDNDEVSNRRLTSMALDVAKALAYLAECNYAHRDVACRNCLVNSQKTVKLSDFGMTRHLNENNYYRFSRLGMLPVRWMAIESLAKGIYTTMSDMWSYGVLLYEIITFAAVPFQNLKNNQVYDRVKAGYTLPIPLGIPPQLALLLNSCWNPVPQQRPTAKQVIHLLSNHPTLILPSLDEPHSAVSTESQVGLEVRMGPSLDMTPRKRSAGLVTFQTTISSSKGSNRKRSMSGNINVNANAKVCSSDLEALNLNHVVNEDFGDVPLLPPTGHLPKFLSLHSNDFEQEKESLVKRPLPECSYLSRGMWTNVTPL